MARISGVNLPVKKRVLIALTYIYGIGRCGAMRIVKEAGVPIEKRVKDLTENDVKKVRAYVDSNFVVEGDLRKEVERNKKNLIALGCYRGLRHRMGLPVRGQNTHSNARTRKGKGKVVANKKKAT